MKAADGPSGSAGGELRTRGWRGQATRQRLLDCAAAQLATTPYRDLKVTDIAREAGTSPATFYQYFVDIESLVLCLAEEIAEEGSKLALHIEGRPWRGSAGWSTSEELVDSFLEFWTAHQPELRVVELLSREGDERFRSARTRMLNAVTRALAEAIVEARGRTIAPGQVDPMAMAGALVSMLAHVSAHQSGFEAWDIGMSAVREAMVRLVYAGVNDKPRRNR